MSRRRSGMAEVRMLTFGVPFLDWPIFFRRKTSHACLFMRTSDVGPSPQFLYPGLVKADFAVRDDACIACSKLQALALSDEAPLVFFFEARVLEPRRKHMHAYRGKEFWVRSIILLHDLQKANKCLLDECLLCLWFVDHWTKLVAGGRRDAVRIKPDSATRHHPCRTHATVRADLPYYRTRPRSCL